jgi:asparagine synthase (glutamine-hydrolysing)
MGVMPETVRTRRAKLGFETPESIWMKENRAEFRALFRVGLEVFNKIFAVGSKDEIIVDQAKTLAWLEGQFTGDSPVDRGVWRMIGLGEWGKGLGI